MCEQAECLGGLSKRTLGHVKTQSSSSCASDVHCTFVEARLIKGADTKLTSHALEVLPPASEPPT